MLTSIEPQFVYFTHPGEILDKWFSTFDVKMCQFIINYIR